MAPLQPQSTSGQNQPSTSRQALGESSSGAKRKVPVTKQADIKEMLAMGRKRRKEMQERQQLEDDEEIRLPDCLRDYNDITSVVGAEPPDYEVSELAVQYAQRHSNIDEIMVLYMTLMKRPRAAIKFFIKNALACCVSYPLKRMSHPFDKFQFESAEDEEVCRTLLRFPSIEYEQQIEELLRFNNKHQLKLCSVMMAQDNQVFFDSRYFLKRMKEMANSDQAPRFSKQAFARFLLHQYYIRANVIQYRLLKTLTVEEIEAISNFKKVVLQEMKEQNQKEVLYSMIAKTVLQGFKDDLSFYVAYKKLVIHPLYEIVINNLTEDQQDFIAADFNRFCKYVNISHVCKSTNPRMTKEEAFRLYVGSSRTGRTLIPFHRMYWIGAEDSDDEDVTVQASAGAASLSYQRRPRFERNTEPVVADPVVSLEGDDSSSDASRITTIPRPQSTPVKPHRKQSANTTTPMELEPQLSPVMEHSPEPEEVAVEPEIVQPAPEPVVAIIPLQEMSPVQPESTPNHSNVNRTLDFTPTVYSSMPAAIPDRFLNADLEMDEALDIIGVLGRNSGFVKQLKTHLKEKYPHNFAINWTINKPLIASSFIYYCWIEDLPQLISIVEKCEQTDSMREAIEMIAEKMAAETNLTQATEAMEEGESQGSTPEIVGLVPETVPVATVHPVVKQEPISQATYYEDSDVLCLGDHIASEIIIDDTQSPDDSLIRDLEAGHSDSPHAFLNLIEGGTQTEEDDDQVQVQAAATISNQTLEQLKEFEPLASRQLRADKQAMAASPRQLRGNKPSTSVSPGMLHKDNQAKAETSSKQKEASPPKVTQRKRFFLSPRSRPGPKSSKRKVSTSTAVEYIDDDSPPGNDSSSSESVDEMNDELSVFLSSQLNFDEPQHPAASNHPSCSFRMVKSAGEHSETPIANVSFLVHIQRVVFEKDFKFDMFVDLPQYKLYHIVVEGANCRPLLNINEQEFNAIVQLLNLIEKYEYNRSDSAPRLPKGKAFIVHQLDMFFSTQMRFKFFNFFMNDDKLDCFEGNYLPLTSGDLTSAIDLKILKTIASHSESS